MFLFHRNSCTICPYLYALVGKTKIIIILCYYYNYSFDGNNSATAGQALDTAMIAHHLRAGCPTDPHHLVSPTPPGVPHTTSCLPHHLGYQGKDK